MALEVGTILEAKYDVNIEHAVVKSTTAPRRGSMQSRYVVETIKSKTVALMTEKEVYEIYNPIGQAEVGRALYSDVEQRVCVCNDCSDCQCSQRVN